MNDTRWTGDQLGRWRDADHLRDLVTRRLAAPGARRTLTIHLDCPSGDGQSFFLRRLRDDLVALDHPVAFLDAARDQAAGDPLIALVGALIGALTGHVSTKLARTSLEAVPELIASLLNPASADDGQPLRRLIVRAQALETLGRRLASVIASLPRAPRPKAVRLPVYLLVDGLDACRPSYAITLIERVRHGLGIDDLVVIMAADRHELARMAAVVQGPGVDAVRFFNRLFDLRHRMPHGGSARDFVAARLPEEVAVDPRLYSFEANPVDYITGTMESFGLNLSEMQAVLGLFADIVRGWTRAVPIELGALVPLVIGHVRGLDLALDEDFLNRLIESARRKGAGSQKLVRFSFFGAEETASPAELFADYAIAAANPIAQGLTGDLTRIASIVRSRLADEYLILHRGRADGEALSIIADYPAIVESAGRMTEV
jgi:hypothetical protein